MNIWLKLLTVVAKRYLDLFYQYFLISGTILATTISWGQHHSIVWAPIHGILGWIYVCYSLQYWIAFCFFLTVLFFIVSKVVKDMNNVAKLYNQMKEVLK